MPGDVPTEELRRALHQAADLVADYLEGVGDYPVLPRVAPGEVAASLPAAAPQEGESFESILADYRSLIEPNVTHWNHPGFMGYFAITGSGPGIVGETLAAGLNVNAMLWRSSPAATELEERTCEWLRDMLGLPEAFHGHINDTASISSFVALAAARDAIGGADIRTQGLAGRADLPTLTVYCSDQAHSSIDKAVIALGFGHDNLRRVTSDADHAMRPDALAAAITADRAAGHRSVAVIATVGTTSSTAVDPVAPIAALCRENGLWLHVDAAYAGSAAICPELRAPFAGWEQADSIVVNPHKWLFTPVDCSVLFVRDVNRLKAAFALVPEYLKTGYESETNLMDLGIQLGRRFRALKLWMVIRRFGVQGLQQAIRHHCHLAQQLASWITQSPDFELCAPVTFSLVCFRWRPDLAGGPQLDETALAERNAALMAAINAAGPVFISHTDLDGRYVLRAAIGNLKTDEETVRGLWVVVRREAAGLAGP